MPDFPLVDSHVHFYDPERISYPWLARVPAIAESHLPADFDRARGGVHVDKVLFVEVDAAPEQNLEEARFAAELMRDDPRVAGLIARAPLERGDAVSGDLAALADLGNVCAIRRVLQDESDPEFCLRGGFIAGVRRLAGYAWPFEACVFQRQLAAVIRLVRLCPETVFVLDHIGKPAIKAGRPEEWRGLLTDLAGLPNVFCKISGVITEADHARWSEAEVRPYIEHAISAFGFDRILFGSDWPVLTLAGDYARWVAILDRILEGASIAERRKFYRENAMRLYRLTS